MNSFGCRRNNAVNFHSREHENVISSSGRGSQLTCEGALHVIRDAGNLIFTSKLIQELIHAARLRKPSPTITAGVCVRSLSPVTAVGRMNMKRYRNKPGGIPENRVDLLRKFCRRTRHLTNVTRTG